MQDNRKTICIDFNGVIDTYTGAWGVETPVRDGVHKFLKALDNRGYKIVVLTSARLADVERYIMDNGLWMVSEVTNVKVPAIVYLDDRAITFNGNFDDALKAILEFKAHWESEEHYEGNNIPDIPILDRHSRRLSNKESAKE